MVWPLAKSYRHLTALSTRAAPNSPTLPYTRTMRNTAPVDCLIAYTSSNSKSTAMSPLNASIYPVRLLAGLFLAICFASDGFTQYRAVPYDPDFGPDFYEVLIDREYPGSYERIEAVDFRNLRLDIVDESRHVLIRAKLKNGRFDREKEGTWDNVKLDSIYYLPSEDSHRRFSIVLYTWFSASGSSNTDGVAQIYELQDGRLKTVQQLEWDEHFDTDRPYASFNEKSQTLTVRSAHYLPGDSHCCVSAADVITLRWDGSRFLKKRVWVELSKLGVSEGKKL